tara:strand:+ start:157 stop:423 length:267 start_codon:yes stop_codon:yes gene_type:complete
MTFNELKFRDISDTHGKNARQAYTSFKNDYDVSIVRHQGSYGNEKGLYEIGVFDASYSMCDPLGWGDDVKGWLTPKDVEKELELIEKL